MCIQNISGHYYIAKNHFKYQFLSGGSKNTTKSRLAHLKLEHNRLAHLKLEHNRLALGTQPSSTLIAGTQPSSTVQLGDY